MPDNRNSLAVIAVGSKWRGRRSGCIWTVTAVPNEHSRLVRVKYDNGKDRPASAGLYEKDFFECFDAVSDDEDRALAAVVDGKVD